MQRRDFLKNTIVSITSLPSLIRVSATTKPKFLRSLGVRQLTSPLKMQVDNFTPLANMESVHTNLFEKSVSGFNVFKTSFTQLQSLEQHTDIDFGVVLYIDPKGICVPSGRIRM